MARRVIDAQLAHGVDHGRAAADDLMRLARGQVGPLDREEREPVAADGGRARQVEQGARRDRLVVPEARGDDAIVARQRVLRHGFPWLGRDCNGCT